MIQKHDMTDPDQEFHDFMYGIFKYFGLDSIPSRVVGILFLEPGEVSLDELSKRTGYSLSSISTKMKILTNSGAVTRIKKPGSKKVYYYMDKDITRIMIAKMKVASEVYLNPAKEKLPKILKNYKENTKNKKDEHTKAKQKIIEDYYGDILRVEGLMEKMLKELQKIREEKNDKKNIN